MAKPATPFVNRSSTIRRCSAAVPSAGIRNSTSTFGSSVPAFSVPRRAIVQKSEALLVTNAIRRLAVAFGADAGCEQPAISNASKKEAFRKRRSFVMKYSRWVEGETLYILFRRDYA